MDQQITKKTGLLKGLVIGLALTLGLILVSIVISMIVINHLGGLEQWLNWREDNYLWLLVWRICLYLILATFWLKLKARMPPLEPGPTKSRMLRIELLVALLAVVIELVKAPVNWGALL
ncbi:hypothetical protein DK254_22975 [Pseudomonas sp. RW407]|uniref:hypothetical protein n=1 Tax=Pseudomonas sp. RW407 TaxID=2202894 RepID=UPI000D6FF668|nr:hypothetical protein [Pseudomonas sp. RW407]PWU28672.1 hypothetical protein DK254_22975 [Pseudomonas sp. RW407]